MTDAPDLKALREKIASADGPSRALDMAIYNTFKLDMPRANVTGSIDAAAAFVDYFSLAWWVNNVGTVRIYNPNSSRHFDEVQPRTISPSIGLCLALVDTLIANRDREARDG